MIMGAIMSKVGIFGGSFNPPHKAHKALIKTVLDQYDLDTVYIMPTAKPPHKSHKEYESVEHRSRICMLMLENINVTVQRTVSPKTFFIFFAFGFADIFNKRCLQLKTFLHK